MLGHSVDTNQRHYSFVREESLESARDRLNAISVSSRLSPSGGTVTIKNRDNNLDISLGFCPDGTSGQTHKTSHAYAHSLSLKNVVDFRKEKSLVNPDRVAKCIKRKALP